MYNSTARDKWVNFKKVGRKNYMNGAESNESPLPFYDSVDQPLFLFADNLNGSPTANGKCRIRKFIIEDIVNGQLTKIMDLEFVQINGMNCARNKINGRVYYGSDNNFIGG